MTASHRRRTRRPSLVKRIFFLLLLLLLLFNIDNIGRMLYPFPYRQTISHYSAAYGVDMYLLVAVMKAESNFNKHAVSATGARGLMQIMPDTGRWIAAKMGSSGFDPDQLFEPDTSIRLGAWYIADLTQEFAGDTVLVLAAYNGGRGNVEEWLAQNKLSGGLSSIDQLPFPETRSFIRKVLYYEKVYRYLYK